MLAGLGTGGRRRIFIGEQNVVGLPPRSRDIAMVFQNYALYPHMNVAENMGFALKMAKLEKSEIVASVRRPRSLTSRTSWSASPDNFRGASDSVSPWGGQSFASRKSS